MHPVDAGRISGRLGQLVCIRASVDNAVATPCMDAFPNKKSGFETERLGVEPKAV